METEWTVYIVECRTKELYVGISTNVDERVEKHNTGRACRYTKFRRPVKLLYSEPCDSYLQARRREREIKSFSREKKFETITIYKTSRPL